MRKRNAAKPVLIGGGTKHVYCVNFKESDSQQKTRLLCQF